MKKLLHSMRNGYDIQTIKTKDAKNTDVTINMNEN